MTIESVIVSCFRDRVDIAPEQFIRRAEQREPHFWPGLPNLPGWLVKALENASKRPALRADKSTI